MCNINNTNEAIGIILIKENQLYSLSNKLNKYKFVKIVHIKMIGKCFFIFSFEKPSNIGYNIFNIVNNKNIKDQYFHIDQNLNPWNLKIFLISLEIMIIKNTTIVAIIGDNIWIIYSLTTQSKIIKLGRK